MSSADGEDSHVPDRGPAVFAVTVATLTVASVFVAARLYCRNFIVKKISWDDRMMALAWLISFGLSFTIAYGTHKGLGKYDADIDSENRGALRRCEYVFSILYVGLSYSGLGFRLIALEVFYPHYSKKPHLH